MCTIVLGINVETPNMTVLELCTGLTNRRSLNPTWMAHVFRWVKGLAIDDEGTTLYYVDFYNDVMGFINLNSGVFGQILQDASADLTDVGYASGYLYFIGWNRHYISKKAVLGPSVSVTVLASNVEYGKLEALHIVTDKPGYTSRCGTRNGECTTLCLPNPTGRTCACRAGEKLNDDGRGCENDPTCTDVDPKVVLSSDCLKYEGEVCTFGCIQDYEQATDDSIIECEVGGTWNVSTDVLCKQMGCKEDIANGNVDDACEGEIGTQCDFQCDDGFQKTTTSLLICLQTREWNMDVSSLCEAILCPASIPNGCDPTIDTICSYKCENGYTQKPSLTSLKCRSTGQWSVDIDELCQPLLCPLSFPNGRVRDDCDRGIGKYCTYSCENGLVENQHVLSVICLSTGLWSTDVSNLCMKEQCDNIVRNGYFTEDCSRHVGSDCNFECEEGYVRKTKEIPICLQSKIWSEDMSLVCGETQPLPVNEELSTGAIIGLSFGVVIFLVVIAVSVLVLTMVLRKKKRDNNNEQMFITYSTQREDRNPYMGLNAPSEDLIDLGVGKQPTSNITNTAPASCNANSVFVISEPSTIQSTAPPFDPSSTNVNPNQDMYKLKVLEWESLNEINP
ncbi:hypothetical protein ScPMuIL_001731 [Solemya velum]